MGVNLRTNHYSPLRYPGGKAKLSYYVQLLIEYNLINDGHYVEPYAGGASVALSLLFNEFVSEVHINDFDIRVYSFWNSILQNTDEFIEKVRTTELTVQNWKKQKNIQQKHQDYTEMEVGFSTFFLNRTNRSGILKAGVIGGKNQDGKWKMDARFNKENLIERIQKTSRFKSRINLYNEDAVDLTQNLNKKLPKNTLFYFDPPYYNKGKDLYINFYEHADHKQIAEIISKLKNRYWLVSYDNDQNISELYSKFLQRTYELNYHANNATKGTEIMIYSDNLIVPEMNSPVDKKEIKEFNEDGLNANWIHKRKNIVSNNVYKK